MRIYRGRGKNNTLSFAVSTLILLRAKTFPVITVVQTVGQTIGVQNRPL